MNVLQVSKFFPPVMGGIETVAWELAEGFTRAGLPNDVLCANHRLQTVSGLQTSGYRVTRAGSLGTVLSTSLTPTMAPLLGRLATGRDIVHLHMPDPTAALALWLARPRCRVVLHWHSDVVRQRRALRVYAPLQRWLLHRADAIIATSVAYAAASQALAAHADKVAVIPIGISDNAGLALPDTVAAIRRRYHGRRIVFSLGRMIYYKGFDVLIDAAAALPDDCVVVIGGEGELLEHHRQSVRRRGLAGRVHLPGLIPARELPAHFAACDVFCMPSTQRAEAYGVALLEAMVMSKPIVATDIEGSGVPWVNADGVTGFNVPVLQPQVLGAALRRLLSEASLRSAFGRAARARYDREFRSERMTRRTIDLYRQLVGAR